MWLQVQHLNPRPKGPRKQSRCVCAPSASVSSCNCLGTHDLLYTRHKLQQATTYSFSSVCVSRPLQADARTGLFSVCKHWPKRPIQTLQYVCKHSFVSFVRQQNDCCNVQRCPISHAATKLMPGGREFNSGSAGPFTLNALKILHFSLH